ncbi:helix-turn-helix domain-containing protein [Roseibium sp. FZY0029]|uniref:winged helix-turn-helix transcriptional regulator n=1 Tax=Roseibium sp. FZY0029 TaxID=3116647 RepID=UPI002EC06CC2|nr:helix-turn-helix domain-containing protein [Roseibium sp. FZY0029]
MTDTAETAPGCALNMGAPLSELMQQGQLLNQNCPSREILRHLTSRWGVLVLIALLEKDSRFSELRRTVGGVSEKMLAQTLQTLETDGFVNRYSHPVVPPHVDYSLTPIGREAAMKVRDFADWIEVNAVRLLSARRRQNGAEVAE